MQTIYLVTGLPGVGKTSFLQVLEGLKLLPEYSVTPQRIARIYNSSETYAMQKLIDDGRSFLCELPLEQEKMEQFFGLLEGKTYAINCYCMGLPDAAEAIARLVRRDRTGVPTAKILEDFELFPSNIRELSRRVESIKFFDNTHMAEYKKRFDRGNKRAVNVEYHKLSAKRIRLKRKLAKAQSEEEKQSLLESIRELDKVHKSIPCKNPMDTNFRRLQYVRYADDFLIGIIGAKEDAQAVKQEIGVYIAEQLKLELSEEKTLVTKATDRAKFLGFDIRVTPQSNHTKKTKSGSTARNYSGHVMLEVPTSVIQKKLLELGAMRIDVRNGTEIWQPTYRGKLVGRTDLSILDQYNGEVRGFCNYYAIANNRSKLHKFRYIMEYSFYKTLACKYRTTKGKIIAQYRIVKDIGVKFQDKHGNERIRLLWKDSLARDPYPLGKEADIIHKPKGILKKPSLGARLKANRCEWCGKETSALVMHQVRTLKELDESQPWAVFMKRINRKTLVVCESCHTKIHGAGCE